MLGGLDKDAGVGGAPGGAAGAQAVIAILGGALMFHERGQIR
jgi:hypothetical protein